MKRMDLHRQPDLGDRVAAIVATVVIAVLVLPPVAVLLALSWRLVLWVAG